jgi:ABC-type lipoprotein release transport system permease subunit
MAVNAAVLLCLLICFVAFVALTAGLSAESMAADNVPARLFATAFDVAGLVFALISLGGSVNYEGDYTVYSKVVRFRLLLWKLIGTMLLLGLSLLPLSVLLLAVPAFVSQESVLDDTTPGRASWLRRTLKRGFALMTAVVVLVTLIAVSVEFVSRLPLPEHGSFGVIAKTFTPAVADFMGKTQRERDAALAKIEDKAVRDFLKTPLHERLPPAMIEHWPFVILGIYALDIVILLFIGKVPLAYNLRNVRVRWKTNLMTAMAFTAVIGLLAFLLAFVNGMNNLTENSGVPGNVFVLSDGSTDEIFSNLGYGDLDNVERVVVELDEKDRVLKTPIKVKQLERGGKTVALASRETYYSINQPVPNTNPPRRRFVQVRSIEDAEVAAEVHNIQLYPGGKWFRSAGVNDKSQIECVLGEGVAGVLGEDTPTKKPLVTGDVFVLGEVEWVVTGLMKSEGTTFGSEIWVKRFSRIYQPFGKEKYTTLVMRTEQDTRDAARAMAHHLSKRYTQQKLKAFAEPDYYAELTKTNNFFLTAVVVVAVVMAIGGVFGMMTTMFASIAQRIRDIGVLRLLGFKRWQVMVSFMLESLTIAVIGGALGVFVAWLLADGRASTSTLSSGGGGPGGKSIALRIDVDAQVMAMGMLFTLVMGRLGGLVPALSAMRMKILDSLR